jgi:chromosome segregation ATPase
MIVNGMQAGSGSDFAMRKEELERKIKELDEERAWLTKEIEALKQRRTLLDLERRSKTLEETVGVLRKEKDDLQGEISAMGSESQQPGPEGQA